MSFATSIQSAIAASLQRIATSAAPIRAIGQEFLRIAEVGVSEAAKLANTGPEKKQFVLDAIGQWFDRAAAFIAPALPWYARWLSPIVFPALRALVLALADGIIETAYDRFKGAVNL